MTIYCFICRKPEVIELTRRDSNDFLYCVKCWSRNMTPNQAWKRRNEAALPVEG